MLAEWTGLEPATPGVTGRYSNQLNYHSTLSCTNPGSVTPARLLPAHSNRKQPVNCGPGRIPVWWVLRGSNPRPSPCKGDALPAELSTPLTVARGATLRLARPARQPLRLPSSRSKQCQSTGPVHRAALVYGILECLPSLEAGNPAGRDLDRLTGTRVASLTSRTTLDDKGPKSDQRNLLARLQGIRDSSDQRIHSPRGIGLRQPRVICNHLNQVTLVHHTHLRSNRVTQLSPLSG